MSKFPPDKEVEPGYYLAHFDQRRFLLKQDKIEVLCSCSLNKLWSPNVLVRSVGIVEGGVGANIGGRQSVLLPSQNISNRIYATTPPSASTMMITMTVRLVMMMMMMSS